MVKKGAATSPSNYRPARLLNTMRKLFARVMAVRLLDAASENASWLFHVVSSRARRPPRGQARSVPQGD
eukprot:8699931-Alexandrium_andersonii.AAC.1